MAAKKQKLQLYRGNDFAGKRLKPSPSAYALQLNRVEGFSEHDAARRRQNMKKKERKKRRSRAGYILIESVMLAIMLLALGKILETFQEDAQGSEHRNAMEQFVLGAVTESYATPERTEPAYPLATPERVTYVEGEAPTLEQLRKMKEINPDFKLWLYIPGTEISYYVLQSYDNDYYLRKNIYREYLRSGSCFVDYRCDAENMTDHVIIYGHTMNDLSVFGQLRGYLESDFFYRHRYLYTCSEAGVTMWRVFSAYNTTTDEYYIETFFPDDEDYLNFITNLQRNSLYATDTQLTEEDDVLTLSTCYRPVGGAKGRLTIHAVKIGTAPIL